MSNTEDLHDDRSVFDPAEAEYLERVLEEMGSLVASGAAGRRPHRWIVPLSVAAAAAIALILLPSRTHVPPVGLPSTASTADLDVESPDRFAVFSTSNPDIAVIWLFKEQE